MFDSRPRQLSFIYLVLALIWTPVSWAADSADGVWSDFDEAVLAPAGERLIIPAAYRTVLLDRSALQGILDRAPGERDVAPSARAAVLSLPLPGGGYGRFGIVDSPIMAPELAERYPDIRTFRGQGIDDPHASVRLDLTPHGFHAAILSPFGNVYVDPYRRGDVDHYLSYFTRDARNPAAAGFRCGVQVTDAAHPLPLDGETPRVQSGTELREYRLAVAATGEYTIFHGGTVPDGMAAIVIAMNRVNGVYEREVAIRMNLIPNNDEVVYTHPATDPYTNNSGSLMLGQNQANLDTVIGDANYDIGHVFSTGGGGIASLQVPCRTGQKARGVTGLPSPIGDVFYVDFVAHEMGHQWGGNHTFNGSSGNCSGGNRNGSTAYEPASGSTIMAYAGICGSQNIQQTSDDYFHGISLSEIVFYSTAGSGKICPVTSATGNSPPEVATGSTYTIPLETPFELCGSATDPDADPLTYGWEQFDRGPAGHPNSPVGDAPIFRSFPPVPSGCRTFPQLSDLVNNTQTIGEILPTYARTMNFRLTARDNRSGGGVGFDQNTFVEVTDVSLPFLVIAPNTAIVWQGEEEEDVVWDVANTDVAPINCFEVDIVLSANGGMTYPHELALGTPNDGIETITVPTTIPSNTASRVKVRCSDNIFFDISDTDFEVMNLDSIFADGFESGDVTAWSSSTP